MIGDHLTREQKIEILQSCIQSLKLQYLEIQSKLRAVQKRRAKIEKRKLKKQKRRERQREEMEKEGMNSQ